MRKFRWLIARRLNKRRDTCWADLVMWAAYPELHDFWEILSIRGTAGFCEERGELPYCGKCTVTGYRR